MSEATYLLGSDSERARRRTRDFSALNPKMLRDDREIAYATQHARKSDRWIAPSGRDAGKVVRAAAESHKQLGLVVVLEPVKPETAAALTGCFRLVVLVPHPNSLLPNEELAEVLAATNRDELFIGGSVDSVSRTLTLWRGNGMSLVVPLERFRPSGDGQKPDFNQFSVSDYGHTLRFGSYESSADAVLYECDPNFRAKLNEKRRSEEKGFGPSLRRLRLQRQLNQTDFDPISAKTIARLERGEILKPRRDTLNVIAAKLGVEPDEVDTF